MNLVQTIIFALTNLASPVFATDLNPMQVGQKWTYEVSSVGRNTYCPAGQRTQEILEKTTVGGHDAFKVQGYCGYVGYTRLEGVKAYSYFAGEDSWYLELDVPEDGRVWREFRADARWDFLGEWRSEQHVFQGCYRKVRILPYTHVAVYCEGIGQVFTEMIDMGGNGWRAHLTAW